MSAVKINSLKLLQILGQFVCVVNVQSHANMALRAICLNACFDVEGDRSES